MHEHRFHELVARKLSGEATHAEMQELQEHLQQHPGDQYLYEMLTTWWSQHSGPVQDENLHEEESFQRILLAADATAPAPPATIRKIYFRRWFAYAAIIIALAGSAITIGPLLFRKQANKPAAIASDTMNEVMARPGSKSKLVLPDGTQVWLNAESRLTYLSNFNQAMREVNLEGEAFFDVTHNKQSPFIVHTAGIDIRVLGTAFNVKSYAEDPTIETTLLRGSIEVVRQNDKNAPRIILRPHEKLVFNKMDSSLKGPKTQSIQHGPISQTGISVTTVPADRPDSTMKETSWVYNKLIFDGDSFQELAEKMERWYNVQITIKNEKLSQMRLKGSFEKETIREALDALKLTAPFEYSISGNAIEIVKR